jgi:hypothetical protein
MVLLGLAPVAHGVETTFCGRAITQEHIDTDLPACREGGLCFHAWVRWTIRSDQVVSGPSLFGQVTAARTQHGTFAEAAESALNVFVVAPISRGDIRKQLGADYLLLRQAQSSDPLAAQCARRPDFSSLLRPLHVGEERLEKGQMQEALASCRAGINAVGDRYLTSDTLDDSGQKLVAADLQARNGKYREAALMTCRILRSRLDLWKSQH